MSALVAAATLICCSTLANGQDLARFTAWKAVCAPTAGCALGTTNEVGDHLAFTEPLRDKPKLLFYPRVPIKPGALVYVTLDGFEGATLGPADGWRVMENDAGSAIQIAPSITEFELMPRMLRAEKLELSYENQQDAEHRVEFSLIGYSDARGYADGG